MWNMGLMASNVRCPELQINIANFFGKIFLCKGNLYLYRAEKKTLYVVARYFFLALLSFSAWL